MPLTINADKANFRIAGADFEPLDANWRDASEARKRAYWDEVGRLAYRAKQRELARGEGVDGKPLKLRKHPRADGAIGPVLTPHRIASRFRKYLDWREGRDGVTLFWGHGWRSIVDYHMRGAGHLPVRDVVGLSLADAAYIRRAARAWWRKRNPPPYGLPPLPSIGFMPIPPRPAVPRPAAVARPGGGRPRIIQP